MIYFNLDVKILEDETILFKYFKIEKVGDVFELRVKKEISDSVDCVSIYMIKSNLWPKSWFFNTFSPSWATILKMETAFLESFPELVLTEVVSVR